jgi:hypothetical protein
MAIRPMTAETYNANTPRAGGGKQYVDIFQPGFKTLIPKKGEQTRIRLLPGDGYPFTAVLVHKKVGADGLTVVCTKHFDVSNPCPLCDKNKELFEEGYKEDAKNFWAREIQVAWVIDRNESQEGPLLFTVTDYRVYGTLRGIMKDEDGQPLPVDDFFAGHDILFTKEVAAEGAFPTLTGLKLSSKLLPLNQGDVNLEKLSAQTKQWVKFIEENEIKNILKVYTPAQLRALAFGAEAEEAVQDRKAISQSTRKTSPALVIQSKAEDEAEVAEDILENEEDTDTFTAPTPKQQAAVAGNDLRSRLAALAGDA